MTLRPYSPADYEMVQGWRRFHAGRDVPGATYPPLGVIVEDDQGPMAALFCVEPAGYPCAQLEAPCSRPGLSMAEAGAAFRVAIEALFKLAGSCWTPPGLYPAFRVTASPAIARILMRMGWQRETPEEERIPLLFIRDNAPMTG